MSAAISSRERFFVFMTLHVTAFAAGIKTWASQGDLAQFSLRKVYTGVSSARFPLTRSGFALSAAMRGETKA
jgi:hypothetical protein